MTRPTCSECGIVIDGPVENDPEIAPHHPIGDGYPSACVRALRAEIARLRERVGELKSQIRHQNMMLWVIVRSTNCDEYHVALSRVKEVPKGARFDIEERPDRDVMILRATLRGEEG